MRAPSTENPNFKWLFRISLHLIVSSFLFHCSNRKHTFIIDNARPSVTFSLSSILFYILCHVDTVDHLSLKFSLLQISLTLFFFLLLHLCLLSVLFVRSLSLWRGFSALSHQLCLSCHPHPGTLIPVLGSNCLSSLQHRLSPELDDPAPHTQTTASWVSQTQLCETWAHCILLPARCDFFYISYLS